MARFSISSLFGKSKGRIFDPLNQSAKDALITLEATQDLLKLILTNATALAKITPLKGFKNIQKVSTELNKVAQATKLLSENELKIAKTKKIVGEKESKRIKQRATTLKQQEKINEQLKKEAGLLGSLQKRIKDLKKEQLFAKTPAQLKKVNEGLEKAQREFRQLSNEGKKSTNTFGKAIQSFGFKFNILANIISEASIAVTSFIRDGISDGFNTIKTFDKEIVNLAAVLEKTKDEVIDLEKEIRRVAETSINTANEVAKTATALVTLGKSESEIIKLLKPVNNLSIALQAPADAAGELLVKTLNAFDESSEEAQRYADVIAKIRTSTAADFEKIKDALGFLAPVAKTAGFSIEETGARIGVLVDNGIKAARAGRLLSTSLLRLASDGKSLDSALVEVNDAIADGATELELLALSGSLFGKEAAAVGVILAENTEKVDEYTLAFENAGGSLQELTDKQLLSLDATLKILKSKWDEQILVLEDNLDVSGRLISVIKFLTENLGSIIKVVGIAASTFLAYKSAILINNIAIKAYTAVTKIATLTTKGFNAVVKANPLGLLAAALAAVVTSYILFSESADDAADSQKKVNKEVSAGVRLFKNLFGAFEVGLLNLDTFGGRIRELSRDDLIELKSVLENEVGNAQRKFTNQLEFEIDLLKRSGLSTKEAKNQLESYSKALDKASDEELKKYNEALALINAELKKNEPAAKVVTGLIKDQQKVVSDLAKAIKEASTEQEIFNLNRKLADEQKELKRLQDLGKETKKLTGAIELRQKAISDLEKAIKEADASEIAGLKDKKKIEEEALLKLKESGDSTILAEIEIAKKKKDLSSQEVALRETTNDKLESLDIELTKSEIESLESRLEAIEETGESELDLKIELNDKLLELEKKRIDEEEKIVQESADHRAEIAIKTVDTIAQIDADATSKRLEQFDKDIQATIQRQSELQERANNGVLSAQESLTTERAKQRKLEAARQKAEEKAELRQAGFKILSALLEAGKTPGEALSQTGVLLAALPAVLDSVPGFIEGTGSGTVASELGAPQLQGRDGHLIRVDGQEKIFNPSESAMIPQGMSNFEVASLAQAHSKGQTVNNSDNRLINEVKTLTQVMKNKPELLDTWYNSMTGMVEQVVKRGNNKETTVRKGKFLR